MENELVFYYEAVNANTSQTIVAVTTGIIPGYTNPYMGNYSPVWQHTGESVRPVNQEIVKGMEGGVIHYCDKHGNMVSKSIKDLTQEEADCIYAISGNNDNSQTQTDLDIVSNFVSGLCTVIPESNFTITHEHKTT